MISTFCKGIGCLLKHGCLRWLRSPIIPKDSETIVDKCDEETRELYESSK